VTASTKRSVLGVGIDAVTPSEALGRVIGAAKEGRTYRVSALAVHGVMEAHDDPALLHRVNDLEMVTPDGQPVRWALNLLYRCNLKERVYGPRLMLDVCREAARENLPVYLLGTTNEILADLRVGLAHRFPDLRVAGMRPSAFRRVSREELTRICDEIRVSGAKIVFVGLGCPRQEIFAYEAGPLLAMPTIAVGAAFEYHAGHRNEPPMWIQKWGLQWLHRLLSDPRRLWRRYATTNPRFLIGLIRQRLGGHEQTPDPTEPRFVGWA